jgi:dTDP-4-dehydrorhamnose reductase
VGLSRHPFDFAQGGVLSGVEGRHPFQASRGAHHLVCDLTDARATEEAIRHVRPDVVIHTQALSDVDDCELNPEEAQRQNVQTTDHLCRALVDRQALLLALSTDYVFDGTKASPYDESDEPNPVNVYGRTKRAGEQSVLGYPRGCVVRTSTLFGPGRANFCDTIVRRVRSGEPIEAFVDQTTSPTYTEDLAEGMQGLLAVMANRSLKGVPRIYHLANAGACRRIEFATRVIELLGYPRALVKPIRMEDQGRPAKRPAYSALKSHALEPDIGRTLRAWDEALHAYLRQHRWTN